MTNLLYWVPYWPLTWSIDFRALINPILSRFDHNWTFTLIFTRKTLYHKENHKENHFFTVISSKLVPDLNFGFTQLIGKPYVARSLRERSAFWWGGLGNRKFSASNFLDPPPLRKLQNFLNPFNMSRNFFGSLPLPIGVQYQLLDNKNYWVWGINLDPSFSIQELNFE